MTDYNDNSKLKHDPVSNIVALKKSINNSMKSDCRSNS
jgi:hypothetical protein